MDDILKWGNVCFISTGLIERLLQTTLLTTTLSSLFLFYFAVLLLCFFFFFRRSFNAAVHLKWRRYFAMTDIKGWRYVGKRQIGLCSNRSDCSLYSSLLRMSPLWRVVRHCECINVAPCKVHCSVPITQHKNKGTPDASLFPPVYPMMHSGFQCHGIHLIEMVRPILVIYANYVVYATNTRGSHSSLDLVIIV